MQRGSVAPATARRSSYAQLHVNRDAALTAASAAGSPPGTGARGYPIQKGREAVSYGQTGQARVSTRLRPSANDGGRSRLPSQISGPAGRLEARPRNSRPSETGPPQPPTEGEVLEFLEGLLEGFRMAGAGHRPDEQRPSLPQASAGSWQDLDEVFATQPKAPWQHDAHSFSLLSPKAASVPREEDELAAAVPASADLSSLSTIMRRHALKAFLEETCGTVANSFDVMAGLALKASLGGSGTPQDRLRHLFGEEDFRLALMGLGYGVGGKDAWWKSLFTAMDVDGDGGVSIQDMYDALVLALPPMQEGAEEDPQVFFTNPSQDTWRRKSVDKMG